MRIFFFLFCLVGNAHAAVHQWDALWQPAVPKSISVGETHTYSLSGVHDAILLVTVEHGSVSLAIDGAPLKYAFPLEEMAWEWVVITDDHNEVHVTGKETSEHTRYIARVWPLQNIGAGVLLRGVLSALHSTVQSHGDEHSVPDQKVSFDALDQQLNAWPENLLPELLMHTHMRAAEIYRRAARHAQALKHVDFARRLAARRHYPWIGFTRGTVLSQAGRSDEALSEFCGVLLHTGASMDCVAASLMAGSAEQSFWTVSAANFIGLIFHNRGELEHGAAWYQYALKHVPAWANGKRSQIINNLGGVAFMRGDYRDALASLRGAYQLARESGDTHRMVSALGNSASVYLAVGDHDSAIAAFTESLEIEKEANNIIGQAQASHRLGMLYLELNQLHTADFFLQNAFQLRVANNLNGIPQSKLQLGRLRRAQGQIEASLHLHREAESEFQAQSKVHEQFEAVVEQAVDHFAQAEPEDVVSTLKRTAQLLPKIQDKRLQARYYSIRGAGLRIAGDLSEAHLALTTALDLHRATSDAVGEIRTLYELAHLQEQADQLDDALASLEHASNVLRQSRLRVSAHELRASFSGRHMDIFSKKIDILNELGRKREALQVAMDNRTQVLLEAILSQAETPDEAVELHRLLAAKLEAARRLEVRWPDSQELAALREEISDIVIQLDAREASLLAGRIRTPTTLSVTEVQSNLPRDELLIVHWLGAERSWLWHITHEHIDVTQRPDRAAMNKAVQAGIESLREARRFPAPGLDTLSTLLLGERLPAGVTVTVVPHNITALVPYNALLLPDSDAKPLIRDRVVRIAPVIAKVDDRSPAEISRFALLVADPVYGMTDPRARFLNHTAATHQAPSTRTDIPDARAADGGAHSYPRLPATAQEVADIETILSSQGVPTKSLVGFEANRNALMNAGPTRASILHFATHGVVDPVDARGSGLVLSLREPDNHIKAELLSLAEIYDLNLRADLVVLSACDTGTGLNIDGEGPISLARGFLVGGARQVVASLWPVNDQATRRLMSTFYENWNRSASAAAALREAQLALADNPRWRGARYWGAFVVVSI